MHGWRARIGIIVSPPNTVCEPELDRMAPEGVSIHTARLSRPPGVTELSKEMLQQTNEDLPRAASSLAALKPDLVLFTHTMASMMEGPDHE